MYYITYVLLSINIYIQTRKVPKKFKVDIWLYLILRIKFLYTDKIINKYSTFIFIGTFGTMLIYIPTIIIVSSARVNASTVTCYYDYVYIEIKIFFFKKQDIDIYKNLCNILNSRICLYVCLISEKYNGHGKWPRK